ncbi:MAG: F0F1 ATP synthase subunit delta [Patescibacteria group bacterium]
MMKKVSVKQLAISLWQALAESETAKHRTIIRNFLVLLARHRQLKQVDRIIDVFTRYNDEQNSVLAVELRTARPVVSLEHFRRELKNIMNKDIRLTNEVEPALIGGAILRYGDRRLDGSVKNQLIRLKNNFSK